MTSLAVWVWLANSSNYTGSLSSPVLFKSLVTSDYSVNSSTANSAGSLWKSTLSCFSSDSSELDSFVFSLLPVLLSWLLGDGGGDHMPLVKAWNNSLPLADNELDFLLDVAYVSLSDPSSASFRLWPFICGRASLWDFSSRFFIKLERGDTSPSSLDSFSVLLSKSITLITSYWMSQDSSPSDSSDGLCTGGIDVLESTEKLHVIFFG